VENQADEEVEHKKHEEGKHEESKDKHAIVG
jgi:hypothetical protein